MYFEDMESFCSAPRERRILRAESCGLGSGGDRRRCWIRAASSGMNARFRGFLEVHTRAGRADHPEFLELGGREERGAIRGANKDSRALPIVPFQFLDAPQQFFQVLEIPIGIGFDPQRLYQTSHLLRRTYRFVEAAKNGNKGLQGGTNGSNEGIPAVLPESLSLDSAATHGFIAQNAASGWLVIGERCSGHPLPGLPFPLLIRVR